MKPAIKPWYGPDGKRHRRACEWRWVDNIPRLYHTLKHVLKFNDWRAWKPIWHLFGPIDR